MRATLPTRRGLRKFRKMIERFSNYPPWVVPTIMFPHMQYNKRRHGERQIKRNIKTRIWKDLNIG